MLKKNQTTRTSSIRPKSPLRISLFVFLFLLLFGGGIGLWYQSHHNKKVTLSSSSSNQKIDYSAAPPADNNANNSRKNSSTNQLPQTLNENVQPTENTSSNSYAVQIVNATVANGNLHIGDTVSGTTAGTCLLTASMSGQNTIQLATSSVILDVNEYDCGVFNIATSKFPVPGAWTITLTVSNNGISGAAVKDVAIE